MEPLHQALEREHRDVDDAVKACADSPVASPEAREALGRAVADLRRHIYVEEELLFPPLRAAGMVGPVLVMLREHAQMWPVLDRLDRALREDDEQGVLRAACRELFVLLQHHNPKEEQILYPQVDHVVGDDQSHGVLEVLETGQMPEGWTCQLLRARRATDLETR